MAELDSRRRGLLYSNGSSCLFFVALAVIATLDHSSGWWEPICLALIASLCGIATWLAWSRG